ncbi:ABC transporter ATP-binding protein [Pseudoduganella violacea]|uniref:Cu-processing system ATP-binding protein n=1 Tax=Pseudoduganella violacea TaxID=1715466 RepID=A0A7W5BEN7_9BURK|nr:ABC transporter ATP-binding protein [Pseudoduganella violacea]MBB3121496.1 Cu-processing system ATP-binding protein [Pseudoduganella violacea]
MTYPPIELKSVSKQFGALQALKEVSLNVNKGEMVGLIGHNGAGKSTLFKLMLGLIPASSGSIRVHGADTSGPGFRQARRRIGYLPESFVTYDNLSGLEVLQLFADLKKVPRSACAGTLELVGLQHAAGRRVGTYSKGMRQRLGFAQALLGEPDLLFLDEPTNGLDPEGIADFYATLRKVKARGATIVITSHILAEIQQRVDRLFIMKSGQLAAQGTLDELRAGMSLPLLVEAAMADQEAAGAGLQTLQGLPGVKASAEGGKLTVSCERERKMAVLSALSATALDIVIHEPTLEELFLGYGGAHVRAH